MKKAAKKILVVGKYYPPYWGGMEVYTRDVAVELAKSYRVEVVAFDPAAEGQIADQGVCVTKCRANLTVAGQPISWSMCRRIRLKGVDAVHFQAPNFFAAALLVLAMSWPARRMPKLVITHHMDVYGRAFLRAFAMPFYRWLLRRADAVIVTSTKNAQISKDLISGINLKAIPLSVDLTDYVVTPEIRARATEWRRKHAGENPLVVFVGRHVRYKGLDVLVRALRECEGVHAALVGSGPKTESIVELARELGIGDRIHFVGDVDHTTKVTILAAADAFVFPSTEITEAFGISQLEAMAVGAPVIASDLPTGVTDVARHGETAVLVPPSDATALAHAIQQLLNDSEGRGRLAGRARAELVQRFEKGVVLRRTVALFDQVLSTNGSF